MSKKSMVFILIVAILAAAATWYGNQHMRWKRQYLFERLVDSSARLAQEHLREQYEAFRREHPEDDNWSYPATDVEFMDTVMTITGACGENQSTVVVTDMPRGSYTSMFDDGQTYTRQVTVCP